MDEKRISSDLDEDEELASLRLAALATLKNRAIKIPEPENAPISNILPINSITRITDFSSELNSHKNKQSWRNNTPSSKRKGKHFPKPSQRSNLIVITPVNREENEISKTSNSSKLLLPQHRWLQSNEDSSSPKTERRTGPSRFNRHCSESESSDSDYDDSDNSYSNDTVLQDENSRPSPPNRNADRAELNGLCSEDRISFEPLQTNLDSDSTIEENVSSVNNSGEQKHSSDQKEDSQSDVKIPFDNSPTNAFHLDMTKLEDIPQPSDDFEYKSERDGMSSPPPLSVKSPVPEKVEEQSSVSNKQKSKHVPIKFDLFYDSDSQKSKTASETDKLDSHRSKKFSDASYKDRSDSTKCVKEEDQRDKSSSNKLLKSAELDQKDKMPHESRPDRSSKDKKSSLSKNDLRFELKRKKETSDRETKQIDNRPSPTREKAKSPPRRRNQSSSPSNERRSAVRKRDRSSTPQRQKSGGHHKSCKRSWSRDRSRSPRHKHGRYNRDRSSSSRSSRSTSSSSSTTAGSSDSGRKRSRPVSSVVQPVQQPKATLPETQGNLRSLITRKSFVSTVESDPISLKKTKTIEIKLNPMSNFKISIPGNDQRNNASDLKKRGPVHMRLGVLPGKRIIQMPKDVEAAFVNSSSDDDNADIGNAKCVKNSAFVASRSHSKKGEANKKKERSEVPKRGKVLR